MKTKTQTTFWLQIMVLAVVVFLIWALGDSRGTVFFAAFLAFLCQPLVSRLERSGWSRSVASAFAFVAVATPLLLIVVFTIPPLVAGLTEFARSFPDRTMEALVRIEGWTHAWGVEIPIDRQSLQEFVKEKSQLLSFDLLSTATDLLRRSAVSISGAIVSLLNLVLIPVFFFYSLTDFGRWKETFASMVPLQARPVARRLTTRASEILSAYLRGQVTACAVLALFYGIGLQLAGLPLGWLIGLLTGLFSFIPYLGFGTGCAVSLITLLATGSGTGTFLFVALVLAIGQFLESFIVTPKLVGHHVGLTPLEALLALIICGNLLGFGGLLLAIPVGALFKELFGELRRQAGVEA